MRMPEKITIELDADGSGFCYQMAEQLADISLEFHEASQRLEALGEKYCRGRRRRTHGGGARSGE